MRLETWDDKQTGAKRSKLKVVADSMQFVGPRPTAAPGQQPPVKTASPPPAQRNAPPEVPAHASRPNTDPDPDAEPEDVPPF